MTAPLALLFDLETTSPNRHKAGIVELAATWYPAHADPLEEVFIGRCRPYEGAPIDPGAIAVNGCDWLNDPAVPTEAEAVLALARWIAATSGGAREIMMMGWNVGIFDWLVLERAWKDAGAGPWPFSFRTIDLHSIAVAELTRRGIHVPSEGIKSKLCCEAFGIEPEPKPHRAIGGIAFEAALANTLLMSHGGYGFCSI